MAGWRAALVVLAALALASPLIWVWSQRSEEQAEAPSPPRDEVAQLREQLAAEQEHTRQLAQEVAALRERVDALSSTGASGGGQAAPAPSAGEADAEGGPAKWFDAEALRRAGMQPDEVDRLRDVFDASEMAVIELQNRAMREGWYNSPRYMAELRDLRRGLRSEIGDETYDQLLYATGRNNRVVVHDVLRGSPGESAGLAPGDVLLSYNGRRIFKPAELVEATTRTKPGETVPVDTLHGGVPQRTYVNGGPLGMRLGEAKLPPETGR
jgi:hypothetical protein